MRLLPISLCVVLAGCAADDESSAGFPAAPYATVTSDSGAMRIEVRTAPDQPPSPGVSDVELFVFDADSMPVDGLDIDVTPWMVSHAHGASVKPTVTAQGGGHYIASSVSLYMAGAWELRMTFAGAATDSAVSTLDVH